MKASVIYLGLMGKGPNCVTRSMKGGRGGVMVWGMFSAIDLGPVLQLHGRMKANIYQNLLCGSFRVFTQLASSCQAEQYPRHSKMGKAVP